ncbi:MAG: PAQR family membrane homeostasis protein TrhA [Nocardioides sp.]
MTQLAAAAADILVAKPRLRGWLHAATAPVTLAAGTVLVALAPAGTPRLGAAVFVVSALVLFTVSAVMHRGRWSPRVNLVLTRLDHASIFVLIAGTYTPFALMLLDGGARVALLCIAWGGAALGIAFRLLRPAAPRWVYTPVYMALGWAAVGFAPDFARHTGVLVLALIAAGGLLYTVGGVVYGLRRPNPIPQWFGFHEVFHSFTVVAFAAHFAGVTIVSGVLR